MFNQFEVCQIGHVRDLARGVEVQHTPEISRIRTL